MEIEQISNKLTEKQKGFFNNLSIYIDTPLYFYGSILRTDYLPGKSDIDTVIFTDNEYSTINMLCNHLHMTKTDFRKFVYKIDSKMVYGYKTKYEDKSKDIDIEICIYNFRYKKIILKEHTSLACLPFFVSICLIIIKFFYYNLGLISNDSYRNFKRLFMNKGGELKFLVVDI